MAGDISPPPVKRRKLAETSKQDSSQDYNPPAVPPLASENTIRIYSWNINGIAPFLQKRITSYFSTKLSHSGSAEVDHVSASLRTFLHRHAWPEVLFLQEVKIGNRDKKKKDAVRVAVNSRIPAESGSSAEKGPKYDVHFVLPTDRHNARGLGGSGKVYGVCSVVRSDLCGDFDVSTRTVGWDREGRVSVIQFRCHASGTKLAVFNIYAVNGTENDYRDPETGDVKGTRHDRKLAFHRSLMEECMKLEREGWGVVMAGDFNVAPDARDGHPKLRTWPVQHCANRADFLEKFMRAPKEVRLQDREEENVRKDKQRKGCWDGVDVWRAAHPEERRYTYYPRSREWGTSCDRVDYVLASQHLWEAGGILSSGILNTELERGPSDHVPIFAQISLVSGPTQAVSSLKDED
jgi:exonuclease III